MRVSFVQPAAISPSATQGPAFGGAEIQAEYTAKELRRWGVSVVSWRHGEDAAPNPDIVHVFNLYCADELVQFTRSATRLGVPLVLSPILWDLSDLAFQQSPRWLAAAALAGRPIALRLFRRLNRYKARSAEIWRTQREILCSAHRILPNSRAEVDFLIDWFALADEHRSKFDVVPNGVDPEHFRTAPLPDVGFCQRHGVSNFVLQVGRIEPSKNQLALLRALYDQPLDIVFVGRSMDDAYCRQLMDVAMKRGRVIVVDQVEHRALPSLYAAAAVHVLPSWRETPGLASLEAAASGCRVVSTDIGCGREYFGDMAWYCQPHDLGSIRRAVMAALSAPVPARLRDEVLGRFTWYHAAEATFHAYSEAIALASR